MLSTCVSIPHAKFAQRKHNAIHWPRQHTMEMKDICIAKVYSAPIFSKTLITGNKLLRNRLRPELLLSSNDSTSYFQLRSYSSDGENSSYLSADQVYLKPFIWFLVTSAALVGIIMLSPRLGPFIQKCIYGFGIGLLFGLAFQCALSRSNLYLHTEKVMMKNSMVEYYTAIRNKIPFQVDAMIKYPIISNSIRRMLSSHPVVPKVPECFGPSSYLSRVEGKHGELTFRCDIKVLPPRFYVTEHNIILKAVRIIREAGSEPDNASVYY